MAEIETSPDRGAILTPGLSLVFERTGDRWTHALDVLSRGDGRRETIARPVEWDFTRDDLQRVVSPVYQEFGVQIDREGRPQVLLIGRAGSHHFSGVFTVIESPEGVEIVCEVADRCRGPVLGWSATYTVMAHSGELIAADPSRIAWRSEGRGLSFAAGAGTDIALAEAGRRATRVQAMARGDLAAVETRTCVWNYCWSFRVRAGADESPGT